MIQPHEEAIQDALHALARGGVIVYPTDTAYALGCDFENETAIARIMEMKGRTDNKFTLIAGSIEQVEQYFQLNDAAHNMAQQYWPGPLSLVVSDRFSVRVPNNDIAQALATQYGKPLIATSANKSGEPTLYDLPSIRATISESTVDAWVDVGELSRVEPSTIIDTRIQPARIIRQGSIHPTL